MKILKTILINFYLLTQILTLLGCSSPSKPSDELIKKEFRNAWYSIHGKSGQKGYRWKLLKIWRPEVTLDEKENKAKATIIFTYTNMKKQTLDRRGDFIFHKKGDTWELEDRYARNIQSVTRQKITP